MTASAKGDVQVFKNVPKTGVIYVMAEARKRGFYYGNPEWANLGQGAPETGPIEGGPERLESIEMPPDTLEYGAVAGIDDLRQAVADLYNHRYRQGRASKYTAENVSISPGGRAGLTRVVASLGSLNLGHFIPDYTAYEELMNLFRDIVPIPILLPSEDGFRPSYGLMRKQIVGMGLGAVLFSNPGNPTGQVIHGDQLASWVECARQYQVALIADEFYSHYIFGDLTEKKSSVSCARYVDDVNEDPVVIVDGLTKNWRYPGLRLSWTLGPRDMINSVASAGSFLDGGAPHPIQRRSLPLLDPEHADTEARAVQKHFGKKREYMLKRLKEMGFIIKHEPEGSFYIFACLDGLPDALRDGFDFFRVALDYRAICVPGVFFDVNPGKRRSHIASRLRNYVRLSYGPEMEQLKRGLDAFEQMIKEYT